MNKNVRLGLVLPLVGVTVAWVALVIAAYLDLRNNFYTSTGYPTVVPVKVSTYVVLAGLAIASGLALIGFKLADAEHLTSDAPIVRATYRFTGLTIVLALAFDVIFAFTTFVDSLSSSGPSYRTPPTVWERFLGVYVPIILVAGLIVYVLLQATLFRKSSPDQATETKGMSETQKALAIGYALPIIGTALAVIIGIAVFDAQRTSIQVWTWVLILLLVGSSIVFGTRSAAKAKLAKPVVRAPRVVGAAGAVTLNYVLSVVFAGVVSIMSFTFGLGAISGLANYNFVECPSGDCGGPTILPMTMDWWFNQMIPAFLLLVLVQSATYLAITSRNKETVAA